MSDIKGDDESNPADLANLVEEARQRFLTDVGLSPGGAIVIGRAKAEELFSRVAALEAVADAAREALRHMERHGVTIAAKKLREVLERLEEKGDEE